MKRTHTVSPRVWPLAIDRTHRLRLFLGWCFVILLGLLYASSRATASAPALMPGGNISAQSSVFAAAAGHTPESLGTPSGTRVPTDRQCTGQPYTEPAQLSSGSLPSGLTTVVDTPGYYQVYATDIDSLRRAVESCTLRQKLGEYHAVTTYNLTWSYTLAGNDTSCRVETARVGLHVNQYLPLYQPTTTDMSLATTWNSYAASLKQHEDGHTAIDTTYAQKLTTALQAARGSCDTIDARIRTITDAHITMLNTANELYDARTNHGVTQGAIL